MAKRMTNVELGMAIDSVHLPLPHEAYDKITDECRRARESEARLVEAARAAAVLLAVVGAVDGADEEGKLELRQVKEKLRHALAAAEGETP